jgi:hypothetical protein
MSGIRVRAIKQGYFKVFREEGVEFEIESDKQFSATWMEKLDAAPEKSLKVKAEKAAPSSKPKADDGGVI